MTQASTPIMPANHLYDDVLHSIFAFIDLRVETQLMEFISPALSCHRWYQAARTMKFHLNGELTIHIDQGDSEINKVKSLCQSSLRHCVSKLNYACRKASRVNIHIFDHLEEIQLAARMSHLRKLKLFVLLDPDKPIDLSRTYANSQSLDDHPVSTSSSFSSSFSSSSREVVFRLPSQLRSVNFDFCMTDNWSEAYKDENRYNPDNSQRVPIHTQMKEVMNMMSHAIRHSSPHLYQLTCSLGTDARYTTFPACAIQPISCISSITHLNAVMLTYQCIDVIRTMHQLRRIDGIGDENTVMRLVYGVHEPHDVAYEITDLPPLQSFATSFSSAQTMRALAYFTGLTKLDLQRIEFDPGEILLAHLPQLTQLTFFVADNEMKSQPLLDSISKYSPQLTKLNICIPAATDIQFAVFLPRMAQLELLILSSCTSIHTLSFLHHTPPSLTHLALYRLVVRSTDEYLHTRHISVVEKINCGIQTDQSTHKIAKTDVNEDVDATERMTDAESIAESTPAPRLVGIELNPGPTIGSTDAGTSS